MKQEKYICLGVIAGAHGVRGQVKIRSFTAEPAAISAYGPLRDEKGREYRLKLLGETGQGLIAEIEGVKDRNAAELLRGTKLYLSRDALPEPEEEEFYYEDLIGLKVVGASGEEIGIVRQVANYGAGDMLDIEHTDGTRELYEFTRTRFPEIRLQHGEITFVLPEVIEARE